MKTGYQLIYTGPRGPRGRAGIFPDRATAKLWAEYNNNSKDTLLSNGSYISENGRRTDGVHFSVEAVEVPDDFEFTK